MLELRGITVRFGSLTALEAVDLEVADGEVVAVLGPSGSGKSTLLRVVAGLQEPDAGTLCWNGTDLAGVPAHRRRFGMVFQDFALFPHLDVAGNVGFGLKMQGLAPAERAPLVTAALERVELGGLGGRPVSTLSGGQAQRVALARALAASPRMLLLDEPLGSLDRALRDRLIGELGRILAAPDLTAVYVTHDAAEAFAVADRVAVVVDGALEQVDTPQGLWRDPATEPVARLLGFRTILDAVVGGGVADTAAGILPVPAGTADGPARLVVRAGAVRPDPSGTIEAIVETVTFRGTDSLAVVSAGGVHLEAALPEPPSPGDHLRLAVDPGGVTVLRPR
jgi:thiamine transport system ATP-binding protein